METVSLVEFRARLDSYLAAPAEDGVVITQDGKPWVVLHAAPNGGAEDDDFARTPALWQMLHGRRQEPGIPWQDARSQYGVD